jgi:NADH:ubiquinone oxidoreductase subunit K
MAVVVDVGLLEVLTLQVGVGLVAVLDTRVVVLVLVAGELMLPGVAVAQVVGDVDVLVVVNGGLVPVLLHRVDLLR